MLTNTGMDTGSHFALLLDGQHTLRRGKTGEARWWRALDSGDRAGVVPCGITAGPGRPRCSRATF